MLRKTSLIFAILIVTSCTPTISNFSSYLPQPFPKTEFMPDADLVEGKLQKVVVFELNEGQNATAKSANLGKTLAINIENVLTKNHLVELVDREIATKLKKEIALAEMNKTGRYKGPIIADYAISGEISSAGFSKKYSNGVVMPDGKGGFTKTDPQFTYKVDVAGNIKVYELPSMNVVESFEFNGNKSRSENVKSDNNISVGGLVEFGGQKAEGLNSDDDLVRKAGKAAIDYIAVNIKNFFSKKGFVLEKRALENKVIFKISVGSADGIKAGDKFRVIGKYETQNSITNKSEIEQRIIASGQVSDKIDPKSSWVLIDDEDAINSIRLGDVVKFEYKRSWADNTIKLVDEIQSLY